MSMYVGIAASLEDGYRGPRDDPEVPVPIVAGIGRTDNVGVRYLDENPNRYCPALPADIRSPMRRLDRRGVRRRFEDGAMWDTVAPLRVIGPDDVAWST
jgi:hypothetical protein